MYFALLRVIAKKWNYPRCSLTDEWLNKLRYIYHVILFRNKKESSIDKTWINLQDEVCGVIEPVSKGYIL